MKAGVLVDHRGLDHSAIKSLASLSEELGYSCFSLYDKSRIDSEYLDTWTILPGVALGTTRIRVTPLVTDNLVRHPGLLAKMAATVDMISHGRLDFGIGAGLHGVGTLERRQRIKMLEESIQVMMKLWTEAPLSSFKGEYFNLEDAESLPKPMQKPHPPILIGGTSDEVLDVVARYVDMSNFDLHSASFEECEAILHRLKECCEREKRSYDSIVKTVLGTCVLDGRTSEETGATLGGSQDKIAEQLSRYSKMGIDRFIVRFPRQTQSEDMRVFAEKVIPLL